MKRKNNEFKKQISAFVMALVVMAGVSEYMKSNVSKEESDIQRNFFDYSYDELYVLNVDKGSEGRYVSVVTKETKDMNYPQFYSECFDKYAIAEDALYYGYATRYYSVRDNECLGLTNRVFVYDKVSEEDEKLLIFYDYHFSDSVMNSEVRYYGNPDNSKDMEIVSKSLGGSVEIVPFIDVVDNRDVKNYYTRDEVNYIEARLNYEGNSLVRSIK
jgi:hypothetical protein